ncbi:MAG: cell division protein ZapA [Pseudomonadota bacterium]
MAEVTVQIGGRPFKIACDDGQEPALESAASLLNAEASTLLQAVGQVPESRMLLMSGLMLADRMQAMQGALASAEEQLTAGDAAPAAPPPQPEPASETAAPASGQPQMGLFDGEDARAARHLLMQVAEALEILATEVEGTAAARATASPAAEEAAQGR